MSQEKILLEIFWSTPHVLFPAGSLCSRTTHCLQDAVAVVALVQHWGCYWMPSWFPARVRHFNGRRLSSQNFCKVPYDGARHGSLPSPPPSLCLRYTCGLSEVLFYPAVALLQVHIPWAKLKYVAVCKGGLASAVQIPHRLVVHGTKPKLALHSPPKIRWVSPDSVLRSLVRFSASAQHCHRYPMWTETHH